MTKSTKIVVVIVSSFLILILAPIILTLMLLFSYTTSPFLNDCVKIPRGITESSARDVMKKYISNPDYETFDGSWSFNEYNKSLSIATDKGFHLKTWRCLIYFKDDKLVDATASF